MEWKNDLEGKKVTVFGLGLHGGGVSVVRFFAESGSKVTVTDLKSKEQLKPSLEKLRLYKNVTYILGQHRREDFINADIIVKSPAIPWNNTYVQGALDAGVRVEMDSSLFFHYWHNPIVGVTGTKGKTTVSLLIARLLRLSGQEVVEVGVGQVPVLDALSNKKKDTVAVCELSSWRLSGLGKMKPPRSPHVSVFKNFLPDHLNYYDTMDQYLSDKKHILSHQRPNDYAVLNYDDPIVRNLNRETQAQVIWFGFHGPSDERCVLVDHGRIVARENGQEEHIVFTRDLGLKGKHNLINASAAIAGCWASGVELSILAKYAKDIEGVPHRLEFVGEVRGIKYYNDTTATIPEATISALHSFTQPVVLIAGGSNKGLSYEGFAKSVSHRVKDIVFLEGSATPHMIESLERMIGEKAKTFPVVDSMAEAVQRASDRCEGGDVVVLSPGAASFGMFQNEFDRGDQFCHVVRGMQR